MSTPKDQNQEDRQYESFQITTVQNGWLVETFQCFAGAIGEKYVFESRLSLSEWVKTRIQSPKENKQVTVSVNS